MLPWLACRRRQAKIPIPEQQNYGLADQHPKGTAKVPLDKLAEIDFDFLLLGVDPPILSSSTKLGSLVD
jgi:hypothetical protein